MSPVVYSTPTARSTVSLTKVFPLDASLYSLQDAELKFMQTETRIDDEEELRDHVMQIQAEAYAVFPFPCIRRFAFLKVMISKSEAYKDLIKLGKTRDGAILLDIGCCFGQDARKAAADGFPAEQIIASDLYAQYWDLGHKLFRSTKNTFPATFIPGDAFDPAHLAIVPPIYATGTELGSTPALATLTSLNPLHGHISAIHASLFFHLFNEEQQLHLAHALGGLLSPLPGSMILGVHRGAPEKRQCSFPLGPDGAAFSMFAHCPESWTELWDGQVFKKGTVKVATQLVEDPVTTGGDIFYLMRWCVTRL
ncbi:hypothetical protein C8Q78DRAFT_1083214 [Trametes maxima]|nr:hypothetical protein C8Q78DRAFT_1083214 [Trametes maxima]